MQLILACVRLVVVTLTVCAGGYTALILGVAQTVTPHTANGSLLARADGTGIVGSSQIAQSFTQPRYFWPRPSAVAYDAAAAGGSNKSPTSADLTARAAQTVAAHGASAAAPLPADLAAASGSGLDPHITEHAALYQVRRVAAARALPEAAVADLVRGRALAPGGSITGERIVNVLELNLALDELAGAGGDGGTDGR